MDLLADLARFFAVPFLVIVLSIILYRGDRPRRYKIVRESNPLGEERYEVWFEYPALPFNPNTWKLEEKFDSEQLANDFITRRKKIRETVREGTLNESPKKIS